MKWDYDIIGNLFKTTSGGTPSRSIKKYYSGNISWLKSGELNDNMNIEDSQEHITEEAIINSSAKKFPRDTVLIAMYGATTGKLGILKKECTTNQAICAILPQPEFFPKIIYYYLLFKRRHFIDKGKGGAQSNINQTIIKKLKFPKIPKKEQKLIVEEIEKQFFHLETSVNALRTIKKKLEIYRNSVLENAFEGRLTLNWRKQQLLKETAFELLEKSYKIRKKEWEKEQLTKMKTKGKFPKNDNWKNKYREPTKLDFSEIPNLPNGWAYGFLEDLIYIAGRIGWKGLKAEEYTEEGPLFLSVYNLNTKGVNIDYNNSNHLSEERYEESPEIKLKNDDILLVKDGAGIGKIGIVKNLESKATVNSSLLVIRTGKAFIPEFLIYFLKGPSMKRVVKDRITGSATPHLFQRDIKKFSILIPPLTEQKEIVQEIEYHFSIIDKLDDIINNSLIKAEQLQKSILKSAFEGKLVKYEGDNND